MPFSQYKLCTLNQTDNAIVVPFGTVAFFGSSAKVCPANWTVFSEADGRFLLGGFQEKGAVSSVAPPLPYGAAISHSHGINGSENTVEFSDVSFAGIEGCCNDNVGQQTTVPVSGSTSSESTNIPYIQYLTCVSQDKSVVVQSMPDSALLFNAVGCPEGWKTDLEAAGRFLVALPRAGIAGAAFGGESLPLGYQGPVGGHDHAFDVEFDTKECEIGLLSGCCGDGYARNQHYSLHGLTDSTSIAMPFLSLPLCSQE